MSERVLSEDDVATMQTPLWERAKRAIDAGDVDGAKALVDRTVAQWASLKDYSINWITSLLTFVAEELGEEAVERALRKTGEEFVRPRRSLGVSWGSLPAAQRARVVARAMLANMGEVEVTEDDEKIVLAFRCGSGGRLIDEGRYDGPGAYATLHERAGRTFMRDALPVYCAHCSVNNEIQPIEWGEAPTSVEHPPERAGERCVHHVYKDVDAMPSEVYVRLGKAPPR
jgi:hypothetical protein